MSKKIFLKSWGCQMNARDSEVIKGLLMDEGYKLVDDEKNADVILFNTCFVRQHAEDKVWSAVGHFGRRYELLATGLKKKPVARSQKPEARKPIIGIIGCMAQNYKEEIFKRAPQVDFVVGPSDIYKIPDIIEKIVHLPSSIVHRTFCEVNAVRPDEVYRTGFHEAKDHAYVVISEGCDNFCTYCVVPYVRGRLTHRDYHDIVKEVKEAVASGIGNITLLGQNVNSYIYEGRGKKEDRREKMEDGKIDFVELLKMVSEIERLKSLSFITSHPKDITQELFELMAKTPLIKKQLHLPIQSGSDGILKHMNRGYTAQKFLEIVDLYRSIVYNGKISTDIIVGFPTESEEDFKNTLDLVRKIHFDSAYIFKYSPRPNTAASKLKDDVPLAVKERRHMELLSLQKNISKDRKSK